jgi:peptidoglycan/xylan/chitin deacetylase (PgdA/CDA1 family)
LRSCGHSIGSHSDTHPDIFRDIPLAQMLEEWQVSCDRLAQLLGEPCPTASLPGGDASTLVFRAAAQAGLHYLFTSEPWLKARRVDGCWILGRVFPKVGTPPERVGELARFRGWRRALLTRRLKGFARRAFPPLYRLYVRRTTTPWQAQD